MIYLLRIHKEYQNKILERERERERERGNMTESLWPCNLLLAL